jgi:hypothetical protein
MGALVNPRVLRDAVDVDAAFGQQLLDFAVCAGCW